MLLEWARELEDIEVFEDPDDLANPELFEFSIENHRFIVHNNPKYNFLMRIDDGDFDRWANSTGAEVHKKPKTIVRFIKDIEWLKNNIISQ